MAALGITQTSTIPPRSIQLQIEIPTSQGWRTLNALLDSGAEENFISQKIIVEARLVPQSALARVKTVNGHPVSLYGRHALETYASDARGRTGYTEQKFLATDIVGYDMILGFPWLKAVNPEIDWKTNEWRYREVRVDGIEEVSAKEFLAEAEQAGSMMVAFMSPVIDIDEHTSACSFIGAVTTGFPDLPEAYASYADVFSEEGAAALPRNARVQHRIEVETGKQVPYGPIYPLSQRELSVLHDYIETNLTTGRIRASLSPAGAPILFVPKTDGSMRLCVDYRGLNKVTVKNRYPLPLLSEILDRLGGACVYTKLDLRDAYHRIPIAEEDIWKTAFRTRYGHFEYTVMPFGLTNAPATFQAYVNEALRGLLDQTCIAYMDDILIFSKSGEDHASHVREILERLRQYKLYAKLSKCEFHVDEVAFLGFRVGVAGVAMDKSRVLAIQSWPSPLTFRDIQVFLGFANFYRGFIPGYSRVVAPITDLLTGMRGGKKSGRFDWTDNAKQAFATLKACFLDAPMLSHFDPQRQCRVETDASKEAAGGILSQAYESRTGRTLWKPVAFFSRKFQKEQRNYGTGDQEMLAIIMAFKEWRHYLDAPAHRTIVVSDHEALQSFMTTKSLQGRQVRWAEYLATFDFEIKYRKGKDNPADALSRRPDHMTREKEDEHPLKELILLRTRGTSDSQAKGLEVKSGELFQVGVLTRGMMRGAREALPYRILTTSEGSRRDACEMHALLPRDGVEGTTGRPVREGPESREVSTSTARRPVKEGLESIKGAGDAGQPSQGPYTRDARETTAGRPIVEGPGSRRLSTSTDGRPYQGPQMRQACEKTARRPVKEGLGSTGSAGDAGQPSQGPHLRDAHEEAAGRPIVEGPESVEREDVVLVPRIPTSLENLLLHLQADDTWCRRRAWEAHATRTIEGSEYKGQWSVDPQGLVRCDGAVYVPNDPTTRADLMRVNHDDPWQGGHFGQERTYQIIHRFYYWPHMRRDINTYVSTCAVCQRMKTSRHRPYGLLVPLPVPRGPWEDISLDFIVGLPPSLHMGVACDSILVVVDRFSKMVRYIPTVNTVDAIGVGALITDHILSKFGVPKSIVSDRGSIFTSSYWESLCFYLATRRCLSTAFHPQTDGQTERMNQTLETYLRCFINYQQDNWAELLACAEYASNQAVNATTGKAPFDLVYRFAPSMRINPSREVPASRMLRENESAKSRASGMEQAAIASEEARKTAIKAMERSANLKRKDMQFQEGDLVKLAAKNIRTLRAHKKLAERFLGPFKIMARVGRNAYRLELPKKYQRLHHTFHVSLLEAYHVRDGCEAPEPEDIDGEEEWEVEQVLGERKRQGRPQFYIRWKGWSEAYDSWEPEEHVRHAREAVEKFRGRRGAAVLSLQA